VLRVVLWRLGLVTSYTPGGFIHVRLDIAIIVGLLRHIQGRAVPWPIPGPKETMEMKIIGVALVILGIVGLVYGRLGYDRQTTILEVGGLKATATEHKTIPFARVAGVIALVGGLVLLVVPRSPRA